MKLINASASLLVILGFTAALSAAPHAGVTYGQAAKEEKKDKASDKSYYIVTVEGLAEGKNAPAVKSALGKLSDVEDVVYDAAESVFYVVLKKGAKELTQEAVEKVLAPLASDSKTQSVKVTKVEKKDGDVPKPAKPEKDKEKKKEEKKKKEKKV